VGLIKSRNCSKGLNLRVWVCFFFLLKASSSLRYKDRTSCFSGWRSNFLFGWFQVQISAQRTIIRASSMLCSVARDKFRYITLIEGCENFPRTQERTQNPRSRKGAMKQVQYWRRIKIGRTKFSRNDFLVPRICTTVLQLKSGPLPSVLILIHNH